MKATISVFAAVLATALVTSTASAQYPPYYLQPVSACARPAPPIPPNPACNYNPWCQSYGGYGVSMPFNGAIHARQGALYPGSQGWGQQQQQQQQQQQGPLGFPTHPYARSPRDFFMLD